jgi:hypothetical protein
MADLADDENLILLERAFRAFRRLSRSAASDDPPTPVVRGRSSTASAQNSQAQQPFPPL